MSDNIDQTQEIKPLREIVGATPERLAKGDIKVEVVNKNMTTGAVIEIRHRGTVTDIVQFYAKRKYISAKMMIAAKALQELFFMSGKVPRGVNIFKDRVSGLTGQGGAEGNTISRDKLFFLLKRLDDEESAVIWEVCCYDRPLEYRRQMESLKLGLRATFENLEKFDQKSS